MKIKIRFALIVAFLALITALHLTCASEQVAEQSARARFKLPKLFDFEHFKHLHRKSYSSLVEELARQKLYLGRAFRVFVSAVAYKNRWSSSYLSVNHLSDATLEEAEQRRLKAHQVQHLLAELNIPEESYTSNDSDVGEPDKAREASAPLPVASTEDIVEKLAEIVEQPDKEPGFRAIISELNSLNETSNGDHYYPQRKLLAENLIEKPSKVDESSQNVDSNNPNYVEPQFVQTKTRDTWREKVSSTLSKYTAHIPMIQYVDLAVQLLVDAVLPYKYVDQPRAAKLADEMFVDHRKSRCAQVVRDQGSCASCYIFATIALYERAYCEATGRRVQFSEQYIVDCGRRVLGLSGCGGGVHMMVSSFVSRYGLELGKHYPYTAREATCPYDTETPATSMGYLRVESDGFEYLSLKQIDQELHKSPMIVLLAVPGEFDSYGGGVETSVDCDRNGLHAMVLEGSGREDGQEFWLLRNSYGTGWGEDGYYKLSKRSYKCFSPKFASRLRNFRVPEHSMTKRVSNEVRKRFNEQKMNKI